MADILPSSKQYKCNPSPTSICELSLDTDKKKRQREEIDITNSEKTINRLNYDIGKIIDNSVVPIPKRKKSSLSSKCYLPKLLLEKELNCDKLFQSVSPASFFLGCQYINSPPDFASLAASCAQAFGDVDDIPLPLSQEILGRSRELRLDDKNNSKVILTGYRGGFIRISPMTEDTQMLFKHI